MFDAATSLSTMFFQEILRIWDNRRHRTSRTPNNNVEDRRNRFSFKIPGFLRFRTPLRLPNLPSALANSKFYARYQLCMTWISQTLTNTLSMNAARIEEYIMPEGTAWAPHSPSPGTAMQLHKIAATVVFCAIYLPYACVASLVTSLLSIGIRSGFPRQWHFSLFLGLIGWLPTIILGSIYWSGRYSINQKRKQSWDIWSSNAERRIREFEGLHGDEREMQERMFLDWMRDGEGDEGWFFEELEAYPRMNNDVESAISLAVPGEQWRSMVYSTDSGVASASTATTPTASDDSSESEVSQGGVQMDDLIPIASGHQSITPPGTGMLDLRSMEGFDAAAPSSNRALRSMPSIDTMTISVAQGAGST